MSIIGFSATRAITSAHRSAIRPFLADLDADGYVTGGCVGGDAFIARTLVRLYPQARHIVVVPADRSRVEYWWLHCKPVDHLQVILMSPGTSHRDRNVDIVERSSRLITFPLFTETDLLSRRSGTWQTVRLARRAGLPVDTHILAQLVDPVALRSPDR
jgi:hypothetical protein